MVELPIHTVAKRVECAFLGHDETLPKASRRVPYPDSRQRFHAPWQEARSLIGIAPMTSLTVLIVIAPAPAEDLSPLSYG